MDNRKKMLLGDERLEWFYFFANREINNVMGYTAAQGFTYFMLRARCWDAGYLPNDLNKLVRWCNNAVTTEDVQFVLNEFFTLTAEDTWFCPELDDLREQAMKHRSQKSERGKKAAAVRWGAKDADAMQTQCNRMPREEEGDVEGEEEERESKKEMETKILPLSAPQVKDYSDEQIEVNSDSRAHDKGQSAQYADLTDKQIAEKVGCSIEYLLRVPPERLNEIQRKARMRIILQRRAA
jgi:uncharacterized protein YdaU (DUF1376 family)